MTVAGWSLVAAGALVLACAIVPVRRRLFRPFALDPTSAVQTTTAALYTTTFVVMVGTFALLYDDPGETILRSEEHTSELQSRLHLVCRLLLEKKKKHRKLEHVQQR